ncbi:MAG: alpha/beta hydrolase-fold protein [Mariniblastus sp.]|nr:alpha/beta hydrolase-fold protein [Mariniblastus sp.]
MIASRVFENLSATASSDEIERLLSQHTFPLVEGSTVTFVFFGEAESVSLRHWIYGLPGSLPLTRLGKSDLWYHSVEFPTGSRIEYKLGVTRNGNEEWIFDPLNCQVAHDPFGGNSVVHGSDYIAPEWSNEISESQQGRLDTFSIQSQALGGERISRVYVPANFRPYRRYRLLVVHDGNDYVNFSRLNHVLDNLIARNEISPLIVALSNPHDRLREYANDRRHAQHVVEELIPELESHYPLITTSSGRCIMGASFGGVAALSTAWHYPDAFDSMLVQSGSFAFTDIGQHSRSPVFDPVVEFMNQFRKHPGKPVKKAYVSCGVYESLIYENRSLVPFLNSIGIKTKFEEAFDGHNWENWRDRLRTGLSWLFPGPLWETYL